MNAQAQIITAPQTNSVGLLNLEAFELSQRVAKMLSSSTLVPEQYRSVIKVKAGKDQQGQWVYRDEENPNGLSNCIIALNMANRMGADPLMIMQNLYLIEGRPAWSSQFIMAAINSCGRFSALRFDMEDLGEKEVEYQETSWANGRKQNVTKKLKIQNYACTAWAIERESGERLSSSKITMEMAVKEGWYQKNGSKWQTMPEQMLRYRAASFFGRVYAPELLMGLKSAEEEQDQIIDVTPDAELVKKADYSQLKRDILAVKSPAELNALEEQVFDIADEEPRKELLKLIKAQDKKFQPKVVGEAPERDEQAAPQSDSSVSVDELKRLQAEAEALVQKKKQPSSADLKKEYAKALNTATSLAEVLDIEDQIENNSALVQADFQYLQANIEQARAKFEKKPESQQPAGGNDVMTAGKMSSLMKRINEIGDVTALEQFAPAIKAAKLPPEMEQEALQAYRDRHFTLSQDDLFTDSPNN